MKRGNTDCRRFQKRRDWIRQRLMFTVKIIFFDAAIGSKTYARQEVLTGIWNPLISGQIVNSFGQGKCTFDCQSGNLKKKYASGNLVSTSSCMLRIEILITFNVTCMWTFHTNSLLHEYLFLMHVHKSL